MEDDTLFYRYISLAPLFKLPLIKRIEAKGGIVRTFFFSIMIIPLTVHLFFNIPFYLANMFFSLLGYKRPEMDSRVKEEIRDKEAVDFFLLMNLFSGIFWFILYLTWFSSNYHPLE